MWPSKRLTTKLASSIGFLDILYGAITMLCCSNPRPPMTLHTTDLEWTCCILIDNRLCLHIRNGLHPKPVIRITRATNELFVEPCRRRMQRGSKTIECRKPGPQPSVWRRGWLLQDDAQMPSPPLAPTTGGALHCSRCGCCLKSLETRFAFLQRRHISQ